MQIKDLDLIWDSCVWINLSSAVLGGDGDLARFLLCIFASDSESAFSQRFYAKSYFR